jgi:hypothetical protein
MVCQRGSWSGKSVMNSIRFWAAMGMRSSWGQPEQSRSSLVQGPVQMATMPARTVSSAPAHRSWTPVARPAASKVTASTSVFSFSTGRAEKSFMARSK